MGRSERRKGVTAELAVRDLFRAAGFDCDRVPASGGLRIRGDLYGDVPLHVEVKRQERLQLGLWLRQAAEDSAGGPYVVAFRQSHEEWYGALPLRFLLPLLRPADRADELERLQHVLAAIAANAESWHPDDAAKGRALDVIATWATGRASPPPGIGRP